MYSLAELGSSLSLEGKTTNGVSLHRTNAVILYKCHLFGVNPPALASSAQKGAEQKALFSSSAAWRAHELFSLLPQWSAPAGLQLRTRQSDCSLCANIERKFHCAWCANQCHFQDHCQELPASTCPPPRIDSVSIVFRAAPGSAS